MGRFSRTAISLLTLSLGVAPALAQETPKADAAGPAAALPAGAPKAGKLAHLAFDAKTKQVRVECETLDVDTPLEFFAVVLNGPEHEAVVRSRVKPSDLHTALLAVGLQPGSPVTYHEALNKWSPPHGPPLQVHMEYQKDGKTVVDPANRWMRNVRTKKPMPNTTWIFAGSRVMKDGNYAADSTGYLISVVNFDMTVIDIPVLASKDNELLEWERNPDAVPKAGTKVTMIIEPAGKVAAGAAPATTPAGKATPEKEGVAARAGAAGAAASDPAKNDPHKNDPDTSDPAQTDPGPIDADGGEPISDVKLDEELVKRATKKWEDVVGPRGQALRQAAQAHYDVINALRREQQRLIDEADRVQRAIDRLERQYQDMTTPQPEPIGGDEAEPDANAEAPALDRTPAEAE